MARWLLVRHGETDWNSAGRIQGRSPTPLNSVGVRQAQLLAERLRPTPLSAIYSSDQVRAMQTADIIASGRDVPVQPTAELRERSFGQWEGFTYMEIQGSDPEGYDEWRRGGAQFTPPGGERVSDVQERVLRLTSRLMDTHPGDDTVLLLGHGGSLRDLAVCVLGLPLESRQRLALANASLSVIDVKSGSATLHLWNDVSHWQGKVPSDDP